MAIIQDWFPPTRENYETIVFYWQLWPVVSFCADPSRSLARPPSSSSQPRLPARPFQC